MLIQLSSYESLDKAWQVVLGVEMGEIQVGKIPLCSILKEKTQYFLAK